MFIRLWSKCVLIMLVFSEFSVCTKGWKVCVLTVRVCNQPLSVYYGVESVYFNSVSV